jgi:regulator of protease activity HflC (stomatin/prohibitin superfamily)
MGISSLIGAVALLGFAIMIIGIGGAVMAASQGRGFRNGATLAVVGLIIGVLFSIISQGVLLVQPQEAAVVFNTVNGSLNENPLRSGTHIIAPVLQQATVYNIAQREFTMSGPSSAGDDEGAVRGRTVDGQEVLLDVTVIYSVDPEELDVVHSRWQDRFETDFVTPTARGTVRDVVSRFRAADIYGQARATMESQISDLLRAQMDVEGLLLTDLVVRDIDFSEAFTAAIEQAQIAEQEAERARLRVQQIQQEAEQARAQAEGQRDAAIARAEGEAQSIILRAEAEAEALRLVSEQIAANPSLIQYQYIQNLSDNIQLALIPANSPFLFDFDSLAEANPDFQAPSVPESLDIVPTEPTPTPAPGGGG